MDTLPQILVHLKEHDCCYYWSHYGFWERLLVMFAHDIIEVKLSSTSEYCRCPRGPGSGYSLHNSTTETKQCKHVNTLLVCDSILRMVNCESILSNLLSACCVLAKCFATQPLARFPHHQNRLCCFSKFSGANDFRLCLSSTQHALEHITQKCCSS